METVLNVLVVMVFIAGAAFAASPSTHLPDGPGKETVVKVCGGCHSPDIVLGHRDTRDGWEVIVGNMVDKGANGTDDEFNTIIDYLAAHLPKKTNDQPAKDSGAKSQ